MTFANLNWLALVGCTLLSTTISILIWHAYGCWRGVRLKRRLKKIAEKASADGKNIKCIIIASSFEDIIEV